jgi:nucleotide-binding universal stress UspA family protein
MDVFQKLLVGIETRPDDLSLTPASRRAALQARWVAERTGASVTLLVADHVPQPGVSGGVLPGSRGGGRELDDLVAELRSSGIDAGVVFDCERPWLALTRQVLLENADLVFVGQRNEPGVGRRPLGTNTLKLLRKCPAPVWVVHPTHELLQRSVLVATDLSDVGARAVQVGAWIAARQECTLHVVHALDGHGETDARAELDIQLRCSPAGVEPVTHVEHGRPSEVILAAVEEFDPDLVVLGTVSRTGIPGLFVGNTAERLMDRIDRSLLTVKPVGFQSTVLA